MVIALSTQAANIELSRSYPAGDSEQTTQMVPDSSVSSSAPLFCSSESRILPANPWLFNFGTLVFGRVGLDVADAVAPAQPTSRLRDNRIVANNANISYLSDFHAVLQNFVR